MEKDSRTCNRVKIKLPLHYKYFEGGKAFHSLEGEVENVGAQGVGMIIDRRIEVGQKLLVTLFLPLPETNFVFLDKPNALGVDYMPVLALADAVWCSAESQNKYKAGIKFVFPDQHHEQRFFQFLNDYQLACPWLVREDNPLERGNA
jgi:hypothetical protein